MRAAGVVGLALALFGAGPLVAKYSALPSSLALVALAVAFACAASGEIDAAALSFGALGALVSSTMGGVATAAGGAIVAVAAYGARTLRARGEMTRGLHVGLALVAGACAGALVHSYIGASFAFRAVASVMAATLLLLPLIVPADDPIAHLLERAAPSTPEPLRGSLVETAILRRHGADLPFDRATSKQIARTWRALARLVEARVRLDESRRVAPAHLTGRVADAAKSSPTDAVATMLDTKIREHIAALARAHSAVDAAHAAQLGLDDAALKSTETSGEALENLSEAIVES